MRKINILACLSLVGIVVMTMLTPFGHARTGYTAASLKGSWAFVEEYEWGRAYGTATGVFTFNGDGGCTLDFVEHGGLGTTHRPGRGEGSECNYEINDRGMGSITGSIVEVTFVMAGPDQIRYVHADEGVRGYYGHGEMVRRGGGSSGGGSSDYDAASLRGRWASEEVFRVGGAHGSYGTAVGIFTFDGKGKCQARWVEHGGASPHGPRRHKTGCEYTVAPNGMGVITGSFVDMEFALGSDGSLFFIDVERNGIPGFLGWGRLHRM